jgi:molecular chaperone GrpE
MKPKRAATTEDRDETRGDAPDTKAAPGAGADTEAMRGDPDAVEAEIKRLRDREEELLRALAEMTNVQKRRKLESEQTVRYAQESLIRELLPVLDDFERALAAMPGTPHDPLHAGVELVRDRMMKILEKEGLAPIQSAGQPFDPNLHDAIGERTAPQGTRPGVVLDVAQPGYMLNDRVLRHAKVVVAGPPADTTTPPSMLGANAPPDTIPPALEDRDRMGATDVDRTQPSGKDRHRA